MKMTQEERERLEQLFEFWYKMAVRDYELAHSDDERWQTMKEIAKVEINAAEALGFDFADRLHKQYCPAPEPEK